LALAVKDRSPSFRGRAVVSGLDMAALTRFAGSGEVITGRLSAKVDLEGAGGDLAAAVRSLGGAARVDIADGVVRNLNLVRNVVLATSGRADSTAVAAAENTGGERFSRLGATLVIAGGVARTTDLQFTSPDVDLAAGGTVALNGSAVDLAGIVQLSPALSKQSGRDLYRYTSVDGRVTLPAAISGPAASLSVRIDLARATERALRNKLNEELDRAIRRNLGGLFKKPPL
jgi:AsmA protein